MHQENLVGKIDGEAVTELPRTEFETAMFNAEKQRLMDAMGRAPQNTSELLSKQAWSLKCLTDDVRGLSKVLYGEQRANATLALRHLEDALHRMNLAKVAEGC